MINPQLLNMPPVINYIDPGTLTMVIQVLIASAIAGAFMIRGFWERIKRVIGRVIAKLWKR